MTATPITLHASPDAVLWSYGGQPCTTPEHVLQHVSSSVVRVIITSPNASPFTVDGLAASPFALRALIPLALWNNHATPPRASRRDT